MKKYISSALALIAVVFNTGCNDPADNVPDAKVNEPAEQAAAAPTAESANATPSGASVADVKSFVIGGDSKINFLASKAIGGEQPGGFKKFEGTLNVADGKLVAAGSKIVIDMDSIWTNSEKLTTHLKNADFFNVPEIPTTTFEATGITETEGNMEITGDLTMHGVKKSISFPAEFTVTDETASLKAEFSINRFDFDMKYPGQADNLIREAVVITLDVTAAPKAANDQG